MHHTRPSRFVSFVAASATAAAAAGALMVVVAPSASAAPRVINVSGMITAFTPKTINVKAGEMVSICLTSDDKPTPIPHDLTIASVGFKVATTGPKVCKTLTAPAAAGSVKFICSVGGHEQAGMVGSLVVAAGGPAAPPAAVPPAAGPPAAVPPAAVPPAQVPAVPNGGVASGGGSTASYTNPGLVTLGGGLLMAAFMSALLGWRVARRD